MKLAAALNERADLLVQLKQLQIRLSNNAKVQEGEMPAEDPKALLKEMEIKLGRLEELMTRINLTNAATLRDGKTMTELLAHRDCLQKRVHMLRSFLDETSSRCDRYTRSEIKILGTVDPVPLQKQYDRLCAELRRTDETLQELNWTVDLM